MSPREVIELSREFRVVDFTLCDLLGAWTRVTVPASALDHAAFDGFPLDGALLFPDPATAFADPLADQPTLALIVDSRGPCDPRAVARRAEAHLRETGLADTARFAVRPEFHLFSAARHEIKRAGSLYEVALDDGAAERFPDVRTEMLLALIDAGVEVALHGQSAPGGPCRIDLKAGSLLAHADSMLRYKHLVRGIARQNGLAATFMPQPLYDAPGARMPTEVSLWKDDRSLMGAYGELSERARWFQGGLEAHAGALRALVAPTTGSYRQSSESAFVRAAFASPAGPPDTRLELSAPDPSANPYLAFAAILMAGLDGIENRTEPHAAASPRDLAAALDALESDHDYLLEGGVFTRDLIQEYIRYKRTCEVDALRRCPHPYEFALYFGV